MFEASCEEMQRKRNEASFLYDKVHKYNIIDKYFFKFNILAFSENKTIEQLTL